MQSTATAPIRFLPAYSHCRRAAKLKMFCITGKLGYRDPTYVFSGAMQPAGPPNK
jgi:hypothetical protein